MKNMLHSTALSSLLVAIVVGAPVVSSAQCILANPSFEIGGSGGAVFGGWNQFGAVGPVSLAEHGRRAARVSGPNSGDWGVSAFWQSHDGSPGERFEITGHVRHSSDRPLTGSCLAIVNVEWRDGAGDLIESTTPASYGLIVF